MPRPGPVHQTLLPSGPGTGAAAGPEEGPTQAGLGCLTSHILETPEEAIAVLEGWGLEKVGEEQVGKTQCPSKGTARHQTTWDPVQGTMRPEDRCRVLPVKRLNRTFQGVQARVRRMLNVRETLSSPFENSRPGRAIRAT